MTEDSVLLTFHHQSCRSRVSLVNSQYETWLSWVRPSLGGLFSHPLEGFCCLFRDLGSPLGMDAGERPSRLIQAGKLRA